MKILTFNTTKIIFTAVFLLTLPFYTIAQEYKLMNDVSLIRVSGTSTLHDWHVDGEQQSGKLKVTREANITINELTFNVKAESLKSGKSSMDKNTYKALKTDKYKDITFKYISRNSTIKKGDNTYIITANGSLTVSGVAKNIILELELTVDGDLLKINGKKDILMTDFGIDPPKALLGTIKTGNEITITYESVFKTN